MNNSGALLAGAYTAAAVICLFVWTRERGVPEFRRYSVFLCLLGIVLFAVGLQQASGGFSEITNLARQQSRAEGWYQYRRDLQTDAIRAIPTAGIVAAAGLLWWVRRVWRRYLPVLLTLTILLCLAAVQAVSHHNIDALLRTRSFGISLKTWVLVLGLMFAAVSLLPFMKRGACRSADTP